MSVPIVYILNTDGSNPFAEMTLASALSARIKNPVIELQLVVDRDTDTYLRSVSHRVLEQFDKVVVVETPPGSGTFKNRWIKTQLPSFLGRSCLYIDSDTIIRKEIDWEIFDSCEFAAVLNHNGNDLSTQIWSEDLEFIAKMNWSFKTGFYLNGGVWFCLFCPKIESLFSEWHSRWSEGLRRYGRLQDQPALNTSLALLEPKLIVLPRSLNEQLATRIWYHSEDAVVWHFFSSTSAQNSSYPELIDSIIRSDSKRASFLVSRFIARRAPWKNCSLLARLIDRYWSPKRLSYPCSLWMEGDLKSTVSALGSATDRRLRGFRSSRFPKNQS